MVKARSWTLPSLITNLVLISVVYSLTPSMGADQTYIPAHDDSAGHFAGDQLPLRYTSSGSNKETRKSQTLAPASLGSQFLQAPANTKSDTTARASLPLTASNLLPRRSQDVLRGTPRSSQQSQSLVAVSGVPYYPVAVGLRRVYTVPYPWVYYVVYPAPSRPPPASPVGPLVNVPVLVHVHTQIVPVQVPTVISNGGGGFGLGDGSTGTGAGGPTADDGTDTGFVPTYGCGTAKPVNCRG